MTSWRVMLLTMVFACPCEKAIAMELGDGFEFGGYVRAGVVSEHETDRGGVNKYALGYGAEEFRLGNEGDTYVELGLKKTFRFDGGVRWSAAYTATYWNDGANFRGLRGNGAYVAKEAYVATSGYRFSPSTEFWAGKRYIEREDVHIVDHFFYSVGGPTIDPGIGAHDIPLPAGARLGISVFRSQQRFSPTENREDATRMNVDVYDLPVARGGKLRVIGEVMHGHFPGGSGGTALTIKYDQADFPLRGVTNSVWLQGSTGYASLETGFGALENRSGTHSVRVIDSLGWQHGRFGGQLIAEYQRGQDEHDSGSTTGTSFGGRISYALARHVKLLSECGWTTLRVNGGPLQKLDKYTAALAFSTGPDLMTRPELRVYATHVAWNQAALDAQGPAWGSWSADRHATNMFGVQVESWW
ncbi:carbohydrate porin [Trinickia caryophylli]|uniref:Maltoporin n=1 Tax=Trinickia caryophylli TaxID=28094 RepID=A0A1X7EA24_TRICW|nr:carbohydrate porin [Trinickia caryophylli]PMS12988.1 porin [Trinickia caryophylli]TRX14749.1 maltoporin [Trinickia caryophylli]WQE14596.1 carbohydrate porin [Trinickia caryophylli]SMF30240.1 maltoporin [Trinickia caryophylli]GLU31989.1 maltoporin [Trinickia caryophylli]